MQTQDDPDACLRTNLQATLDRIHHAASSMAVGRMVWIWGGWPDLERLNRCLDLPTQSTSWRDWCTGPGGSFVTQDPKRAVAFLRYAVPQSPQGNFVAVAFEKVAHKKPFVVLASSAHNSGWFQPPLTLDPHTPYSPHTHRMLAGYGHIPFWVGTSAHDELCARHQHASASLRAGHTSIPRPKDL